jgi:hypothetical protein
VLEGVQNAEPILVAPEDGLPFILLFGDVVDCAGVFDA